MGSVPSSSSVPHHQIHRGAATGILNISNRGLREIPEQIFPVRHLRLLDLSANRLTQLPAAIQKLAHLKSLYLNQNRLTDLPEEIGSLAALEFLSCSYNFLASLPASMGRLGALREIRLSHNRFGLFPRPLTEVNLRNLDLIDLSMNRISSLGGCDFSRCQVEDLNLNQNAIRSLTSTLAEAPRLKVLRLQNNLLTLDSILDAILSDSTVTTLLVEGNGFEMRGLEALDGHEAYLARRKSSLSK